MCAFTAVISQREREIKQQEASVGGGEKAKFAAAHFCARWPCFGARVLGTLIWSRPRESVKLRAALCYHSGRLPQPAGKLASKREVCWEPRRNTASEGHVRGRRGGSRAQRICLTCDKPAHLIPTCLFTGLVCLLEFAWMSRLNVQPVAGGCAQGPGHPPHPPTRPWEPV